MIMKIMKKKSRIKKVVKKEKEKIKRRNKIKIFLYLIKS